MDSTHVHVLVICMSSCSSGNDFMGYLKFSNLLINPNYHSHYLITNLILIINSGYSFIFIVIKENLKLVDAKL